ncbi:mechanosensitive ion channel [Novosphingobium flavum]|uniref:Mechanosensitive ion channel n=1 Tax=Novosphingobium flavum TaxID=1778672 RepID=A0A7X1FQH8_9SPHN|nr:mechanosensitive ion channel domain-containing protein [Novosphingobium flavum]MBC2665110.1 mechanosensitive ion channel [Novosphingobium flavum]
MISTTLANLQHLLPELLRAAIAAGIAVSLALLIHLALFRLLKRLAALSSMETDELVVNRLREPLRWSLVALAIELAGESAPLLATMWGAVDRFVVPALLGWVVLRLVKAYALALDSRARLEHDSLSARSRRTRIAILSRSLSFVIVFVTVALMLLSIPGVRNVGVTLITSAGLAALAVGAAAQPALKSLIAGIQMALTEPIRIDDHVVVEGESGRIEDIRMTYVVIRTSDERRLIVPTAKFLETTFQNWTRVGGGITGSVIITVRPGTPVAPIRKAYDELLAGHPEWDQRSGALQVTASRVDAIELTLVMSAADPASLSRLRLALREEVLEWLRCELPQAVAAPEAAAAAECAE